MAVTAAAAAAAAAAATKRINSRRGARRGLVCLLAQRTPPPRRPEWVQLFSLSSSGSGWRAGACPTRAAGLFAPRASAQERLAMRLALRLMEGRRRRTIRRVINWPAGFGRAARFCTLVFVVAAAAAAAATAATVAAVDLTLAREPSRAYLHLARRQLLASEIEPRRAARAGRPGARARAKAAAGRLIVLARRLQELREVEPREHSARESAS